MDAQLKAKWVEALRSGKYEQTTGTLENSRGQNCCLGVLCRVQGADFETLTPAELQTSFIEPEYSADLDSEEQWVLSQMNDKEKKTFAEIADYIEANL